LLAFSEILVKFSSKLQITEKVVQSVIELRAHGILRALIARNFAPDNAVFSAAEVGDAEAVELLLPSDITAEFASRVVFAASRGHSVFLVKKFIGIEGCGRFLAAERLRARVRWARSISTSTGGIILGKRRFCRRSKMGTRKCSEFCSRKGRTLHRAVSHGNAEILGILFQLDFHGIFQHPF
jgi:hypothetical protein